MKSIEETLAAVNSDTSMPPDWCYRMTYSHEPYYLFLYRLVNQIRPKLVVELGTDKGTSGVFMSVANSRPTVISIDIERVPLENLRAVSKNYSLDNLITYLGSSTDQSTLDDIQKYGKIDLLFIDTIHTFEQASTEYRLWKPLLSDDALVVHDDTRLGEGMKQYWQSIPEPKVELLHLHHSGFGISR